MRVAGMLFFTVLLATLRLAQSQKNSVIAWRTWSPTSDSFVRAADLPVKHSEAFWQPPSAMLYRTAISAERCRQLIVKRMWLER
jgi:hypothetical protein